MLAVTPAAVSRRIRRHRRPLAAVAAALAVWALVSELRPPVQWRDAVAAARDVPAGTRLSDDDLVMVSVPDAASAALVGIVTSASVAAGRVTSIALPARSLVPMSALVSPVSVGAMARELGAGMVAVAVRPVEPQTSGLFVAGDRVDVWASAGGAGASPQARRVASSARVLAVVRGSAPAGTALGSSAGAVTAAGGLVVLAIPSDRAGAVARAIAGDAITLALLSG